MLPSEAYQDPALRKEYPNLTPVSWDCTMPFIKPSRIPSPGAKTLSKWIEELYKEPNKQAEKNRGHSTKPTDAKLLDSKAISTTPLVKTCVTCGTVFTTKVLSRVYCDMACVIDKELNNE